MSTGQSTPIGCDRPPPPALLKGIEQFNDREYFECHETLEALWNIERAQAAQASKAIDQGTSGTVYCDNLYKGILQVGVGCYHLLRHNYRGATIKLQSGADYLEPFAPRCMGVEVGRLIADARQLRTELVALGPERFAEVDLALLPLVRLTTEPA
jgi:uncharacterized protein